MASETAGVTRLISVPNEFEAAAIVAALADHGIVAQHVGGYTAGFKAKAPGLVQVLVKEEDLQRARAIIEDHDDGVADVDWSTVDCGDASPVESDEDYEVVEPCPWQVSLMTLLVIQSVICLLFGIALSPVATFLFMALIVLVTYAMIAIGTVKIFSEQVRPFEQFRYLGLSLAILGVLFYAIQLIRAIVVGG